MKFPDDRFTDPKLVTEQLPEKVEDGPEGETSLQLLQAIYKNRKQPLNVRVRCAIEALAHEYPKVSAVQVSHMNGHDFANALERAIQSVLEVRGRKILGGGAEWFRAGREEVSAIYRFTIERQ